MVVGRSGCIVLVIGYRANFFSYRLVFQYNENYGLSNGSSVMIMNLGMPRPLEMGGSAKLICN